jgi:bifunctional polynucleotide phosphatase/kinase
LAGFDLDWTLIRTKTGRQFASNANDWLFWHESVPEKLRSLHSSGHTIVIFTNQGGVASGNTKLSDLRAKFTQIQKTIAIPMLFMAAIGRTEDAYRKPSPLMF